MVIFTIQSPYPRRRKLETNIIGGLLGFGEDKTLIFSVNETNFHGLYLFYFALLLSIHYIYWFVNYEIF